MMTIKQLLKGDDNLTDKEKKFRELFTYLLFGGLTTVVNLVAFAVFDHFVTAEKVVTFIKWEFDLYLLLNQTIAWLLAVIFAFVTNRAFVFLSNGSIVKEFLSFVGARIATFFIIELGTFALFVMFWENVVGYNKDTVAFSILGFDVTHLFIIKIINAVILVIVNYILSKVLIFKRHEVPAEAAK